MQYQKKLQIIDANILYLIGAVLLFTIGSYFQHLSLKSGLIITQYILILMPPIIYMLVRKIPIQSTMRLNKLKIKHGILIVFITLLMYPTAVFGNALFMTILSLLGNLNIPELPTATDTREYVVLLMIISISAGICEEVFFRGFILPGYEKLGTRKAIIISSILFGVFHFNLYNLVGPIVLGLVFSYLVILTNSLYAGIIGHIVNNGFAVTLGFLLNRFSELPEENYETAVEISTTTALFINVVIFGLLAIGAAFIASKLINIIKKDMKKEKNILKLNNFHEEGSKYEEEIKDSISFTEYIPLVLMIPLYLFVAFMQLKEIISLG
ncbi:hypothetical protein SAMN05660297_02537 [Natronincola peptidivorans]|uniref:CAAX prenyl protease 2/Lysostaphin resistance protein A-like domain-containing protein n=1 Tax=Natronincola peptidivorans TaxID=426128 RepID=A0A1I0ET74_9FIRM|nr:type II CAAX endopeptidase family protein [Natronincola peptidivorans]SET48746.1 hypothetical protein SAMN05660297_02537 [Natronincola peptidivorans]